MLVTIVVLNWNDSDDTLECISSIKKLVIPKGVELNTIVVDNNSDPSSVNKLKDHSYFELIENKKNLGYSGGNNVGIKAAIAKGSDYVWILNPDLRLDTKSFSALVDFSRQAPHVSILSPKIYFYPGYEYHKDRYSKKDAGKVIWYAGGFINWTTVLGEHYGVNEVDKGQFDGPNEVGFATGASLFFKKDLWNSTGGFDEKFFLYLEDADLCLRAKKIGLSIYFVPNSIMWHKNAKSSGVGGNLHDYYFARNRMLFGMRHGSTRLKFALVRESMRILLKGRQWQKRGVVDFYLRNFGQGSFTPKKNQ
jgi:GT2 family glycosyltransferase